MLQPPGGTLAVDAPLDPRVAEGVAEGHWLESIPVVLDRAALEGGQRDFDVFCATCHGVLGDGESVVAARMDRVRPRDLQTDVVRAYPPGRTFQTIRQGYGLMPSYRVQLDVTRAWHVVAYLRALQVARGVRAADLPQALRAELAKEAP